MKKILVILFGLALMSALTAQAQMKLKSEKEKLSYSMGVMTGKMFKKNNVPVTLKYFYQGMTDGFNDHKTLLSNTAMQDALNGYQKKVTKDMQQKHENQSEENLAASKAFFTKNKKESGVMTTDSGLQYKVIEKGSGQSPTAKDKVTVQYEGKLLDGKVFDSSYKSGKPITFPVNAVIPGWQEALKLMKPGAKWMLYIPPNLAYGERGVGNVIGPNEALIFKIELISVSKK